MNIQNNVNVVSRSSLYNDGVQNSVTKSTEKSSSEARGDEEMVTISLSDHIRNSTNVLSADNQNKSDDMAFVKVSDGALSEMQDVLNQMSKAAEASIDGTYMDATGRTYQAEEIQTLIDEVDHIVESAKYDNMAIAQANKNMQEASSIVSIVGALEEDKVPSRVAVSGSDSMTAFEDAEVSVAQTDSVESPTGDFINIGGEYGTDYIYEDKTLTILSDEEITIRGNGKETEDRIVVDSESGSANVTLENVNINTDEDVTAFDVGDNDVSLTLVGRNTLASGEENPMSITVGDEGTVEVGGSGALSVAGEEVPAEELVVQSDKMSEMLTTMM